MNELTKAELEIILRTLAKHKWCNNGQLRVKIAKMINNYCEHENDDKFNCLPMDGSPKMCKKCRGFYI